MDNEESRNDEIAALSAIYPDEWKCEDSKTNSYSIEIVSELDQNKCFTLKIDFKIPMGYPLHELPIYTISAPWMTREDKQKLLEQMNTICNDSSNQSILNCLVEEARQFIDKMAENYAKSNETETKQLEVESIQSIVQCDIPIYHGEPLVDRKSTFQAHLAPIRSVEDVELVLCKLKENRKISAATHNMWAYRLLSNDTNIVNQNCDDDGEQHAGSRLLHLLQIVDAKNVFVVVSRWYGGIQLGPDRFKHINNVARDLLQQYNYINK